MTAADWSRAREFWDRARQWLTRVNLLIAAVAVIVFGAYCAGSHAGQRKADQAHYRVIRDTLVDTIRVVNERLRVDTVRVRVASAKSDTARHAFAQADSVVRAVADTSDVIPASVVLPALKTCEVALQSDSVLVHALRVSFEDAVKRGDYEQRRADLAESQLAKQKPSRFGFKSGLLAGAALVLAILR